MQCAVVTWVRASRQFLQLKNRKVAGPGWSFRPYNIEGDKYVSKRVVLVFLAGVTVNIQALIAQVCSSSTSINYLLKVLLVYYREPASATQP